MDVWRNEILTEQTWVSYLIHERIIASSWLISPKFRKIRSLVIEIVKIKAVASIRAAEQLIKDNYQIINWCSKSFGIPLTGLSQLVPMDTGQTGNKGDLWQIWDQD